ncbi:retrotransposon gag domain-containing protein [Corynebacterium sp. MC-13]|nr:retrotransposon gag domain-containing protein [Corynebacterium parakroppenstedtii]
MSNLAKLEFVALDITGKNYLSWVLDAEIHLDAKGLGDTIKENNQSSNQDKAKAMIFLRHHLHEGLKREYLTVKDPLVLWDNLKDRYDHQKTIILPKARYEWMHLRLQDFKSVSNYNSAVFKITSTLKLCGENITDEDMLEKTFSTFHASNLLLQQQYREKGFKKYSELISCLLVAEQNNELLLKNHDTRPTGYAPFPEANAASYNHFNLVEVVVEVVVVVVVVNIVVVKAKVVIVVIIMNMKIVTHTMVIIIRTLLPI